MTQAIVEVAAPAVVVIVGVLWGLLRLELGRYAAAHPHSQAVKDVQTVLVEASAAAAGAGVTPGGIAAYLAGWLSAHGHHTTAQSVMAQGKVISATASAVVAAAGPVGAPAAVPAAVLVPNGAPVGGPAAVPSQAGSQSAAG